MPLTKMEIRAFCSS